MGLALNRIGSICLVMSLLCLGASAHAADELLLLDLPGGQELEVQRFAGSGKPLLLWLPSERGLGKAHEMHARDLARLGYEVWLADLHDAYFIERNRRSIARFPLDDVVAIVDAATRASGTGVFLLSSSRGAQLSLVAAREWQQRNPGKTGLRGAFLAHAHLYLARPEAGESAAYLPIVGATNLPIYLIDAQYSTRSSRTGELAAALGAGGSKVFVQVLEGLQGGFFARDDGELSALDQAAKGRYAVTIDRAIKLLSTVATPTMAVATAVDTREFSRNPVRGSALEALTKPRPAPVLRLSDYQGNGYSLDQQGGRVLLINFWASWCKPCVKEIPSLHRLRENVGNQDFEIVTVNVGENRDRIAQFLERVPIELPLLLDLDGAAAKEWKIYVYPSSYLVDHRGHIRYAYLGALEWDSTENITIIQNLLTQR